MIGNPGPGFEFRAGDEVGVLGEASQIAALKDLLGVVS
jgi:K+/H+ antiporter YhaU regulatory subunit KhtT